MYYVLLAVEYAKFQIVNFGNEKYLWYDKGNEWSTSEDQSVMLSITFINYEKRQQNKVIHWDGWGYWSKGTVPLLKVILISTS